MMQDTAMEGHNDPSSQGQRPARGHSFRRPAAAHLLPKSFLELDPGGRVLSVRTYGPDPHPAWTAHLLGLDFFGDLFSHPALLAAEARYQDLVTHKAEDRFLETIQVAHEGRALDIRLVFTYSAILEMGYVMIDLAAKD
mgnify:CR=1 FL=1